MDRLLPILDQQQQNQFDDLLGKEKTGSDDILGFFAESIPTFPEILGDELLRTKEEAVLMLQTI